MNVARVNGRPVGAGEPALSLDDPLVRAGDGLIETMRARRGVVFRLETHLDRLAQSAEALGMRGLPDQARVRAEIAAVIAAAGDGDLRVRLAVSTAPTLWVEATDIAPLPWEPNTVTAITLPGGWRPELLTAQHKTASRAMWAWAERQAAQAGADTALLLDGRGRMGEATTASVFVRVDGEVLTAPVAGLLPGVAREVLMAAIPGVVERAAEETEWRRADEIILTSALHGVVAVTRLDGRPVGTGKPGPMARGQQSAYRALVEAETGGA